MSISAFKWQWLAPKKTISLYDDLLDQADCLHMRRFYRVHGELCWHCDECDYRLTVVEARSRGLRD